MNITRTQLGGASLAFALCGLMTTTAQAGTLQLRDSADLLTPDDESALRTEASRYNFDVRVLTDTRYADRASFDRYVAAQVSSASMVVVGVDPMHRRTSVHFGTGLRVATNRYTAVENAGDPSFRQAQWRQGIDAILGAAQSSVNTGGAGDALAPAGERPAFPWGLVLLGGGAVLVVAMLVRAARRRAQPYGAPPAAPYRGYEAPPQQYASPYGYPPPPQSSGLGAGLMGAGLGGLAGYALGRSMSEHDDDAPAPESHDAGWDAGGGTSDWDSGGGGGDFGGGDAGGGGGGDW